MNSGSVLEAKEVLLYFGYRRILYNLSIAFWSGHVHSVIVLNGTRKSTLTDTIMGLSGYTKFEGDIVFKGKPLIDKGKRCFRHFSDLRRH
jgi:Fe-S cluster assembly ATP-binding protein